LVDHRCSHVQARDLSERSFLDDQQQIRGGSFADDIAAFRRFDFEPVRLVTFVADEREPIGLHFHRLIAAEQVNEKRLHGRNLALRRHPRGEF